MQKYIYKLIEKVDKQIIIFDADFFWYFQKNKELILPLIIEKSNYSILTPNEGEFSRLWKMLKPGIKILIL